jgi:acetyltransferase-like isoleucine patch superfamily enzyme
VTIGEGCVIGKDVYIDQGVRIGNRAKIQNSALLYRPLEIHDGVFIGPRVVFTNDRMPRAVTPEGRIKSEADWSQSLTVVEEGASLGAGAIILPGLRIGAWAMVGAGAVATRDVAAYSLVTGTPARPVGWLCRCGEKLKGREQAACPNCAWTYEIRDGVCVPKSDAAGARTQG